MRLIATDVPWCGRVSVCPSLCVCVSVERNHELLLLLLLLLKSYSKYTNRLNTDKYAKTAELGVCV